MSLAITLSGVRKTYAGGVSAVAGVDLTAPEGALVALLGPSGCGKTTTLRLIAGLERPDKGVITICGRTVADASTWAPPEQRQVGLVFQDGALFPHLSVAENISFALTHMTRAARTQRVTELLDLVGLGGLAARYAHQLSGGQQQRIALARALASRPAVVLLDEPFANLDAALRVELREEVARILRSAGTTALLVTHDQQEALSMADQVALMLDGRIAQYGAPQQLYGCPSSRAVANFLGETNWIPGEANGMTTSSCLGTLHLTAPVSGSVDVLVRPEQLILHPDEAARWSVTQVRYFGHDQIVTVSADDVPALRARRRAHEPTLAGLRVAVAVHGAVSAFGR
jgi:iron(III) transport system ATP-binding protein